MMCAHRSGRRLARLALTVLAPVLAIAGCARDGGEAVAYSSVDQVFAEPVFREFEKVSGTRVRGVFDTEEAKSTGLLNRLIAEGNNPQADVFWSGDPVRAFVLIRRGLVQPYVSPNAATIPAQFKAADGSWTGFAARARVLLVNKNLVPAGSMPTSIRDLANPRWKGQTAIANPIFSTATMHVAALFTAWGDDSAKRFLDALKANGIRVVSSNGEVKRLVAAGEVALGLTDTDDANEALKDGAPVEVVYPDQDGMGTLVMPTVAVLLERAPHADAGRRLIDYLVSARSEEQMARLAAHMPLGAGVPRVPGVRGVDQVRPMQVDYARVAETMERIQPWLRRWVGL